MKINVSQERLYRIWIKMHSHCEDPDTMEYKYYGGKGISVCEEWDLYSKFCAWAWNNGYAENLFLIRINKNGNFNPENCKWRKYKQNSKLINLNGESLSLSDWADITSVDAGFISKRLSRGWTPEEAIGMKTHERNKSINIRKRNEKWEYRFEAPKSLDGKRHHISKCGFPTKEEALKAGKKKFNEIYNTTEKSVDTTWTQRTFRPSETSEKPIK